MNTQTTPTARYTLGVRSNFLVVGHNPEMADLDRPNGEIVKEVYELIAEDTDGNRFVYGSFRSFLAAETSISSAPPVYTWADTYPAYGSVAYETYGESDTVAWERRQEDDHRVHGGAFACSF